MCRKFIFLVSFVLVLGLASNARALNYVVTDIGGPGIAGSVTYDDVNDIWTVSGSGGDIWGNSDQFYYVCRPLENGIMKVNLVSMDVTHEWAKVGVMIRETLDAGSKHALMAMTGNHGNQFVSRADTGGGSTDVTTPLQVPPKEMWIERDGDTLKGTFWNWIIEGVLGEWMTITVDISMNAQVYIGLAVCSVDNGVLCEAVFDNVLWPAYNKAWQLSPADGMLCVDVDSPPTLTWTPGDSAATHEVWFGPEGAMELVATKDLGDESYTPDAPLLYNTTYEWQIVEVESDANNAHPGLVYSLRTERLETGTIMMDIWEGIGGTIVSDLTSNADYPGNPDSSTELTVMDSGTDVGDDYGGQMVGYLNPETDGNSTFWIAADDGCELWLSTSEKGYDAVKIAYWGGWTGYHAYDSHAEQKSVPIPLVGGQKYMIRALWKEGGGGDHCSVAWEGPDAPSRTEIDGCYYLSTGYVDYWAMLPSPADGTTATPLELETVSWTPGATATSHNVYLGTDPDAMALVATVAMPDTSCTLPSIEVDTTYYWMVEADDGTDTYPRPAWSINVVEWVSIDIGRANPEPAGSSSYDPCTGVYTLKSGGNELWGNSDEFHFLYTTMRMTRDTGSIKARVLSIEAADSWRRAGVMIRESAAANAAKIMTHKTGHNNTRMQARDNTGDGTWGGSEFWDLGFPMWVRLDREGNQYNGYFSQDGENWTHMNSHTVNMTNDYVLVGLAMCHHNSQPQDQLSTGMFDNLSITTPDPQQSWNPSPSNGAEGVPIDVVLGWNAGEGATLQHLYFSDNYADVEDGTAYIGEFDVAVTEYDAGALDLTKTYYWAVDMEVRAGRDYETILGEIWSFTIEEFLVIDNFEAYDDPPVPLEEPSEQVVIDPGSTIPGYTIEAVEPDAGCLIAEWAFEGNYDDTSGSGFHGTPVGDANIVNDATRGDVLSLDGDLDYVNCGNPAALNFSTGDWSLSAWVKNTMTGTGDENKGSILANGGDTGGGHRYCLILSEQDEGEVTLVVDDDSDKRQAKGDATKVNDGVWHHVLGVRDGDTTRIYIDGVEEGSAGLPAGYDLSGTVQHDVLIGAITDAPDPNAIYKDYGGLIDDVQIYDCALTEGNARFLADVGDLVVDPIVTPPTYGPLIAEYLVELPDPTADTSGNNIHGTPLGDVTAVDDAERGLVASFDGNGDAVDIGDNERFNFTDDFSISVWVNLNSWGGSWGNVIVGKRGEGGVGWQLRRFGGDPRFSFTTRGMGGDDYPRSDQTIAMNQWYHLAAVRDGDQKRLYIDGMLESTEGINNNRVNTCAHKVYIGARANGDNTGPESFFDGMIDELRIYEYALTWGQVLNLAEYTPTNPIADTWSGIVYGGLGSMRMEYDNSQYVYQALSKRDAPFADWTAGNAKALSMWFRGDPGNAADLAVMYVTLQDDGESASVYYDGDRSDLNKDEWQEWNIAMGDFAGVNADSIGNIEVGVVGLGGPGNPGGQIYFDDMCLHPSRCISEYGPLADFTGDCIVDTRDLRILAGEWLLLSELPAQEWDRVAYYDGRYPTGWADTAVAEGVRDYLSTAGYTVVDADELKTWMDARIADGALSVVVMCQDIAPDTVAETRDATCTLRRYLDAGGKVVQYADIPFYNQGHADGSTTNWATDGSVYILGFNAAGAGWGSGNTVTITDAGANWGLTQPWPSNRPALAGDVDTILATDDDGDASAWAKRYVPGDNCRGFVYIADFDPDSSVIALLSPALQSVAEYKADSTLVTDLYEDGTVNLKDYATIAEEWLEVQLFPAE